MASAYNAARTAGLAISKQFGEHLSLAERRRLVALFRTALIPAGRPGRKRRHDVTSAYNDWKEGMRGLALYKKHIRGWDQMSHWRRQQAARRLSNAVHTMHKRRRLDDLAKCQPDKPGTLI